MFRLSLKGAAMNTSDYPIRTAGESKQNFFDSQGAGVFIIDFDSGGIVEINNRATEMVGLSETSIIGKRCDIFLRTLNNTPLEPSTIAVDGFLRGDRDRIIPVIISTAECRIREHKGLIHTFIEISKNSRTLEQRNQRASDYLSIINGLQNIIFYQTDMNGILIDISNSVSRVTGFTREEVIGKSVNLFYSNPNNQNTLLKELLSNGSVEEYSLDLQKKDGSIADIVINSAVIHDSNGNPDSILSILHDITETTRAIESHRYSEKKFKTITQSIQDAIIMMNDKGLISFVNRAGTMMFGYTKEEMLYTDLHELIAPPQYLLSFRRGFEAFRNTGKGLLVGRTLEIEARRKNGSKFPVELSISATKMNDSWYAIGIIRDITERRRAEKDIVEASEAAENASRTKSEFLTNMSHEIRTPLNTIIGATGLLSETNLDNEQMKLVEMMHSSGESLLALINDILDISRIEAGKITLEEIFFNLNDLVKKICDTLSVRSSQKNLEMTYEIKPGVPDFLVGDPNRLRQILVNLIGNAIKFTEKGSIRVSVENMETTENSSTLKFSISDTGIGIPSAKLESIFNTFTQADASVTRKFGGTGLGLAISKKLIHLMHGDISVESTKEEGTTFSFTAKFDIPEKGWVKTAEMQDQDSTEIAIKGLGYLKILLVDDSLDNRFLINAFLKNESCSIVEADNGSIAVELFPTEQWDIILMDMQMPVMDGYQATRRIREIEKKEGIGYTPIVALTAHSINTEVKKCFDAGCDVHLAKPVSKADLLKVIRDTISKFSYSEDISNNERIEIHADPDLMPLIPGYIEHRHDDVGKMKDLLENNSFRDIERCGHSMKGSGAGYGFDGITEIGGFIEIAGKEGNREQIQEGINRLKIYLEKLDIVEGE